MANSLKRFGSSGQESINRRRRAENVENVVLMRFLFYQAGFPPQPGPPILANNHRTAMCVSGRERRGENHDRSGNRYSGRFAFDKAKQSERVRLWKRSFRSAALLSRSGETIQAFRTNPARNRSNFPRGASSDSGVIFDSHKAGRIRSQSVGRDSRCY